MVDVFVADYMSVQTHNMQWIIDSLVTLCSKSLLLDPLFQIQRFLQRSSTFKLKCGFLKEMFRPAVCIRSRWPWPSIVNHQNGINSSFHSCMFMPNWINCLKAFFWCRAYKGSRCKGSEWPLCLTSLHQGREFLWIWPQWTWSDWCIVGWIS